MTCVTAHSLLMSVTTHYSLILTRQPLAYYSLILTRQLLLTNCSLMARCLQVRVTADSLVMSVVLLFLMLVAVVTTVAANTRTN